MDVRAALIGSIEPATLGMSPRQQIDSRVVARFRYISTDGAVSAAAKCNSLDYCLQRQSPAIRIP
jgi:hypothetical protein